MRSFADRNPVALAVYFLATAGVAMLCMEPVILSISLAGALLTFFVLGGRRGHGFALGLFLATALINPLVSHNGRTVLFVLNHSPITLEALLYGLAAGGMLLAALYWLRGFSAIMTSDKLLYLFGGLSPKLALVLSMALRYVPLLGRQGRKVHQAQLALGLYREDNLVDGLRGGAREFSILTTWALENGIVTADSMSARGYGLGPRSRFFLFSWRTGDVLLAVISLALAGLALAGAQSRRFAFYPQLSAAPMTALSVLGYAAYAVLALLPAIFQLKEAIRWRLLQSKI
ncbi:MAG: cobalt transport protein [Clostridia bacterium]|nr:cobalt transport protein [Clostridia bacterium]